MLEAAFFDLDKTTIDGQGQLYPGLRRALDPQARHFVMTTLTARGYPRYREAVTENPALQSTPGVPIALENGGRIVDSELTANLHYSPFSTDELTAICDYIAKAPTLRYVGFHSRALRERTKLWSPDPVEVARMRAEWSHNAEPFTGPVDALFRMMHEHDPCLVIARTASGQPANLPAGITAYDHGSTVNFVPEGVDKGVATRTIADIAGIALPGLLYAGNDVNDLPALRLDSLGCPVAVGPDITPTMLAELPPHVVHLPDQRQLAGFVLGAFA